MVHTVGRSFDAVAELYRRRAAACEYRSNTPNTGARVSHLGGSGCGLNIKSSGSAVTFFGQNFNFPLGDVPILDGTLTGDLADGTHFDLDFLRQGAFPPSIPAGRITLVPEPGTALLVQIGIGLLAMRRGPGRR